MPPPTFRSVVASGLVVTLALATAPVFAAPAPAPATLTGTVYSDDVATPQAGVTVVVTDASGVKLASRPTGSDGAFTVPAVAPGRTALALETKDGSFAVATPVTLAPGQTRGVHLALKAAGRSKDEKRKPEKEGDYWTGGAIGAMTAVLVGFVAAAVVNTNDDNVPASPSFPEDK